MEYSAFNKPTRITNAGHWTEVAYGPDKHRVKRTDSTGRTTYYVGGLFEATTHGGVTEFVHYVGDFAVYIEQRGLEQDSHHQFLHRDHLGSIVAKTTDKDTGTDWLAYSAWGNRLLIAWDGMAEGPGYDASTARGFTGHEHLDPVGLIHMNGRVYDPELGRFLSPDPLVQAPHNTQSYNRYSYVFNNPLSFTDPSGYCGTGISSHENGGGSSVFSTCDHTTLTGHDAEIYSITQINSDYLQRVNVIGRNTWAGSGGTFYNTDYFNTLEGRMSLGPPTPTNVDWGGKEKSNYEFAAKERVRAAQQRGWGGSNQFERTRKSMSKWAISKLKEAFIPNGVIAIGTEATAVASVYGFKGGSGIYYDFQKNKVGYYSALGGGVSGLFDAIVAGVEFQAGLTFDYAPSMSYFRGTHSVSLVVQLAISPKSKSEWAV